MSTPCAWTRLATPFFICFAARARPSWRRHVAPNGCAGAQAIGRCLQMLSFTAVRME